MDKQQVARTVRLNKHDIEAIAAIREHYGITSDNEAIRFALKMALRDIRQQSTQPKPQ